MSAVSLSHYLDTLTHSRADEVRLLADVIASADPEVVGTVKWNAPSFGYPGTDRVTFRLQPGDRVEIVLHRGAAKRTDEFRFVDGSGLVKWASSDRGVIAIADRAALDLHLDSLLDVVTRWLEATRD